MTKKKLLIIDDDEALTGLLYEFLSTDGYEVTICNTGEKGLDRLSKHDDLVLLDVMLPGIDGFEVLKQIRKTSRVPILMLTAKGDEFDCVLGLELGADDYLPKPYRPRELLARIKALLRRQDYSAIDDVDSGLIINGVELNSKTHQVSVDGVGVELTQTEYLLLQVLLTSAGAVVSKQKLSEQGLGRRLMAYDRSIDMHVSNLRKKLQNVAQRELLKTVRGSGYLFLEDEV